MMKNKWLEINNSWEEFCKNSKYLNQMIEFVETAKNICPLKENVFRFFNFNILNAKCIILGMDPYPSTYEIYETSKEKKILMPVATGRAFEVANVENFTDKYKQASLSNIFKALWNYKYNEIICLDEIRKKVKNEYLDSKKNIDKEIINLNIHKWFDNMEKQGVVFLNATLTTEIGKTGAHISIWKNFIDELINYIVEKNKNVKWLIWGKNALERVEDIVDKKNIIYTCHPASQCNNTFVSDCCFNYIKEVKWF